MFHCFSICFTSLDLSETFSWAYVPTPVHYLSQGTHGFLYSRNFQAGHNILRAKLCNRWHWGNTWNQDSVKWRTTLASGWLLWICSLRRCPGESNSFQQKKKKNFKWISTTFNHYLFRNNVFYKLVFITYVSDIQFRWDSSQQSKHIFDLRYQPMHLSWIINFQKCGRHWIVLNTACVLSHFSRVQLCSPMDCRLPGPSVHRILQARILEWIVIPFSRGSSQPRDWTCVSPVSCISRQVFYH